MTPSRERAGDGSADLLRKERFGALYYSRARASFYAVPGELAHVLVKARTKSALEVYAADPAATQRSDEEFARQALAWQKQGILDDDFRMRAQVVDEDRSHGGITGPLVTHVQLTRACNLRCTHCYVDIMAKPHPDELSARELDGVFADLERLGSPVVVLAGGEPMVRRDLFEILTSARARGIDGWLCTNATLVNEENAAQLAGSGLRGVSVSLDGPDAETHERLRGEKRFEHALRGIRLLVAAGAPDVQLRVTVTPENAARLLGFADVARDLGVDKVVIKPFRQSGEASAAGSLWIGRTDYVRAIEQAQERWPDDVAVDFGDGMPARPPDWTSIIPSFGCVGGTTSLTVTYTGHVMGCGAILRDDDWNVREHGLQACWQRAPGVTMWRTLAGNEQCTSCGNFKRCGGGCRARAVGRGLSIDDSDPWAYCSEETGAGATSPSTAARGLPIVA
jgi:radical SAM protein with 4Fe4S-binding SPASM domain